MSNSQNRVILVHMFVKKQYHVISLCLAIVFLIALTTTGFANQNNKKNFGVTAYTYFHVGDPNNEDSSVSQAFFETHLSDIGNNEYSALSPATLLKQMNGTSHNDAGHVLLTFEGAYQNFYDNVWPLIRNNNYNVLVFIPVDNVGQPDYMSWSDIKNLAKNDNIHFGINGCSYISFLDLNDDDLRACLNRAIGTFKDQLGERPLYFSLPYGIYDERILNIIRSYNFELIFGQHSGIIDVGTKDAVLPRFPMTGSFGDPERFRLLAQGGSLDVSNVIPSTPVLIDESYPLNIGMTIHQNDVPLDAVKCFLSEHGALETTPISETRLRITISDPLPAGRHRINCTYYDETDGTFDSWQDSPDMRWWGTMIYKPDNQ